LDIICEEQTKFTLLGSSRVKNHKSILIVFCLTFIVLFELKQHKNVDSLWKF